MKSITHIFISHAVLLALFGGAVLALAQEEADTETTATTPTDRQAVMQENIEARQEQREEVRETRQENVATRQEQMEGRREAMEEKQEERQEMMEERRAQLQARVQERITNLAANMSNRMEAAVTRMEDINDRFASRLEKLEEAGVDTSEAAAALASAQLSVNAAKAGIADIDDAVASAVGAEDVRATWAEVKTTFGEVRDHLRTAHSELRAAVAVLKAAVQEAELGRGSSAAVRSDNSDNETGPEEDAESTETTN